MVVVEIEFKDTARQRVVEYRDELGQLLGADALRQHVEGQLADIRRRPLQRLDIRRRLDGLANLT